MKESEIIQKVIEGELILEKTYLGKRHKRKYVWDKDTRNLLRVDRIEFDGWGHRAVYKDNQDLGYRISKKVYNNLLKTLSTGNLNFNLRKLNDYSNITTELD